MEEAREEVETLKDIFDDCIVDATETSLTVELTPTTDGDRDEHGHLWVRIVVDASIPGYPAAGDAKFSIEKQRGLSNQQLRALSAAGEVRLQGALAPTAVPSLPLIVCVCRCVRVSRPACVGEPQRDKGRAAVVHSD